MGPLQVSRLSRILPLLFLLMACTPTGSLEPALPPSTDQPTAIVISPETPEVIVHPTMTMVPPAVITTEPKATPLDSVTLRL